MADKKYKKAVFFNNQAFNVRSYFRAVTDDLVSRFSSSEQGQTNLDLLKALTQEKYRGGMFQRKFDDVEKVSTISGAYYNKLDDNLYPTPLWRLVASGGYFVPNGSKTTTNNMNGNGVVSWCYFKGSIYIAFQSTPPGALVNKLYKVDPTTGTFTVITLPSALANNNDTLKIIAFDAYIFIACQYGAASVHRYDGTTFTDVSGGIHTFMTFNNKLYGVNTSGDFYDVTNHTSTPVTFTAISKIGGLAWDPSSGPVKFQSAIEYNGALYIGTTYGLFRYDGVSVKAVLNYKSAEDSKNFRRLAVFNGRLYYTIKNKLYQFDGVNIEELQDFTIADEISDMCGGTDRLWITTKANTGVSFGDKFNPAGTPEYQVSTFCYDGVGFFRYKEYGDVLPVSYTNIAVMPVAGRVFVVIPDIYLNVSLEERSNGFNMYSVELADEFTTTHASEGFEVISSIMDCDYPAVAKVINGIMTNYGGLTAGEGSFSVEMQYLYNGVWSAWTLIWNTQNVDSLGATNDYLLHERTDIGSPELLTVPAVFHAVRIKTTLAITDTTPTTLPYLSDQSIRYTIQPRMRLKWLLELDLAGYDKRDLTTPTASDGQPEDRSSTYLRKIIYDAYRNKLPLLFYDVDWTEVKDSGTFTFEGVDFIDVGDTIAIQDALNDAEPWINRRVGDVVYDDAQNETAVTLDPFGSRIGIGGSVNTGSQNGAQIRKSYAVYIRQLRNERYIIDDNTLNDKDNATDIPSTITLEIVEV